LGILPYSSFNSSVTTAGDTGFVGGKDRELASDWIRTGPLWVFSRRKEDLAERGGNLEVRKIKNLNTKKKIRTHDPTLPKEGGGLRVNQGGNSMRIP